MKRLMNDGILISLPNNSKSFTECVKGKLTKIKRNVTICSSNLLKLIHTNIFGPLVDATSNGLRYLFSFLYNFFRCAYSFLIADKFSALEVFKIYKAEVDDN